MPSATHDSYLSDGSHATKAAEHRVGPQAESDSRRAMSEMLR